MIIWGEDIINYINKFNPSKIDKVLQRIDTFQDFMENLENATIVENTHNDTSINSQYLAINTDDGLTRHLGLLAVGEIDYILDYNVLTALETYILQDNDNYYKDSLIKEPVTNISFYDDEIKSFITGSFNLEKNKILEEFKNIDSNQIINQKIKTMEIQKKNYRV